jgi:hypothetical protein
VKSKFCWQPFTWGPSMSSTLGRHVLFESMVTVGQAGPNSTTITCSYKSGPIDGINESWKSTESRNSYSNAKPTNEIPLKRQVGRMMILSVR